MGVLVQVCDEPTEQRQSLVVNKAFLLSKLLDTLVHDTSNLPLRALGEKPQLCLGGNTFRNFLNTKSTHEI